jgi:hypothetical protein
LLGVDASQKPRPPRNDGGATCWSCATTMAEARLAAIRALDGEGKQKGCLGT